MGVPPHRRRLLIVLLRRWRRLLIISAGRLGTVRGGQIGRSCWILRLIGLRWLTLGTVVRDVGFTASCNSKRQRDGCGCQNDQRRYFVRHIPSRRRCPKEQLHLITLSSRPPSGLSYSAHSVATCLSAMASSRPTCWSRTGL